MSWVLAAQQQIQSAMHDGVSGVVLSGCALQGWEEPAGEVPVAEGAQLGVTGQVCRSLSSHRP